jgi:hypothetical protein
VGHPTRHQHNRRNGSETDGNPAQDQQQIAARPRPAQQIFYPVAFGIHVNPSPAEPEALATGFFV